MELEYFKIKFKMILSLVMCQLMKLLK